MIKTHGDFTRRAVLSGPLAAPFLASASTTTTNNACVASISALHKLPADDGVVYFSAYVVGDAMDPRLPDGELMFLREDQPPRVGDDVLVEVTQKNAPAVYLLRRLIQRTASFLLLEQFNPRKKVRVATDDVIRTFRVVPLKELLRGPA